MRTRIAVAVSIVGMLGACKKKPPAADDTVVDAATPMASEMASASTAPSASAAPADTAAAATSAAPTASGGGTATTPFSGNYACVFNGVNNDMHLTQSGAKITGLVKPAPPQHADIEDEMSCTVTGSTAACSQTVFSLKPTRHANGHRDVTLTLSSGSLAYVTGSMHATCKRK